MQSQFIRNFVLISCLLFAGSTFSQEYDTEFMPGWAIYLQIDNGAITNFHRAPDVYAGGVHLAPQYTVITHRLRAGVNAGFVYAGKKFSGLFGPEVSLKIKSFNLGSMGGVANLHVTGMHNWGTDKQALAGIGLGIELLQKIMFRLSTQRDYRLNTWWIQSHVGINLTKARKTVREFNQ